MKFDTVLFDLGGTLIIYENKHSWRELAYLGCRNAASYLNNSIGVNLQARELSINLLGTLDEMLKAGSENLTEVSIYELVKTVLKHFEINAVNGIPAKFVDDYYKPTTEQIVLESGAVELLTKLKAAGMKIGLVSNSIFPAVFHRDEMTRFGILEFFDFTIFSSELGIRKPNREIYQEALKRANSKPESTVFVGDRKLEDVAGPQESGIRAILKYVERRDYSLEITPFREINELGELENILLT